DGATLVLQALHRTWQPVAEFCAGLGTELGHPVQANAYVTPPQNRGFDDHYDVHDVFVLQIEGTKRWLVHRPVHFEFETLSLTYVGDSLEAETRQCTLHRLALRVEDLRLEHDVDYDACHWHSRCVVLVLSRSVQRTRPKFLRA
ncbi:hypothetical protein ADL27_54620, partial [Streptomyces sp. NRRL F-6602]